ncbi:AAA family ATPase [Streptosporangium sp. NBC_01639]|uniref:helix-turn-helix transcriptional regulator n=1 Tax=Streptosporangium sp. NBC_01639 TaxID=2975948 RepID=UPI003867E959|nr:AAA family ATPase [Streptosporangium sp. NBC_01639]
MRDARLVLVNGPGALGRTVSPLLVGRDQELERLVAAVTAAPSVSVVEGEAGIGKSRLLAELAARPELADRRLLSGGCGQIREPFPLGPIVEAIRGRATDLTGAALSPVAGALRGLLPELEGVLPQPPPPLENRAAERHRLFRGLVEVLAALGPAILVVEDLHWADEQTVEFLGYLLGTPQGELSVVLTYRGDEAAAAVRAMTARPPDSVRHEHLALAPLDTAQTRTLAAAILGVDEVTEEFAEHLRARASGLPLAVQELLALLRTRGALIEWEGGWARRTLDALDVPVGVRASVQERVSRLPAEARAVVETAAVLQLAVPVSVLAHTAGRPEPEAMDGALDSGLLAERDGTVGFRHVLAAQAVYEAIPVGRRRAMHAAAAAAVQELRQVPLGQMAHHLRQSGRTPEWADAAARAAEQAAALGDEAEAARLLEDLLRNAELDPVRRAQLTVRLGWAALQVLPFPQMRELITEALRSELPTALRGELRFLSGMHFEVTRDDPTRRNSVLAGALEDLGDRPDLAAWALVLLGLPIVAGVSPEEERDRLNQALGLLPAVEDRAMRVLILGKLAMVFVVMGDARWADLTEQLRAETGGHARDHQEANAYCSIAEDAGYAGHHDLARSLLETALDTANPDLQGVSEQRTRTRLTIVDYCRGAWGGLRPMVDALRRQGDARPHESLIVDTVAACLAPAPGRLDLALDVLRDVVGRAFARGDFDLLPVPVSMLLRLAVARGEHDAAIAETAAAVRAWESKEMWPAGVRAVPALVETLLAAGRGDDAAELVERYEARLRGLDAPLAVPALGQARGLLQAADQRWAEAARSLTAAAEGFRALPAAYDAAQADEQAAACLLRAGDPAAGPILQAVTTVYAELGARWDLDRANLLGRTWGVRLPQLAQPREAGGSALSSRQEQVARLAATGLTNQEIAKEMFLSPKTVDKHLSAAMRKVGARSRTELALFYR